MLKSTNLNVFVQETTPCTHNGTIKSVITPCFVFFSTQFFHIEGKSYKKLFPCIILCICMCVCVCVLIKVTYMSFQINGNVLFVFSSHFFFSHNRNNSHRGNQQEFSYHPYTLQSKRILSSCLTLFKSSRINNRVYKKIFTYKDINSLLKPSIHL